MSTPFTVTPCTVYHDFQRYATNISEVRYEVCWTEDDGLYACGCGHLTIADAMSCVARDGRHFIRAVENGASRSLNEVELSVFIVELIKRRPGII